jgi:chromosome segregation ATPase
MPDLNTREAQLLQARERMARSFERLQKLVALIPERIKKLEEKSSDTDSRKSELQELLDRERVITSQRIALDESNREEIKLLQLRVQSLEKDLQLAQGQLTKKDATIVELESMLADFRAEVSQKDVSFAKLSDEHSTTKNITDEVLAKLDAMQDAYRILQQQCFRYESQIAQMNETDSAIAVKMNDSQRTTIIAEIDAIIASLDTLTPSNGIYSR